MKKTFLLVVLLISFKTYAQEKCPCFDVLPGLVGCAPYSFSVKDCSGGTVLYQYNGSPLTSDTTHTFTSEGIFNVVQSGNFTCGEIISIKSKTLSVTVKPIPAPKTTTFPCANNKVYVVASDPQYDEYKFINTDNDTVIIKKGNRGILNTTFSPFQVKGNYNGAACGGSATLNITESVSLPAAKINKLSLKENNSIDLEYNNLAGEMYEVQIKDNINQTYVIHDTIKQTPSLYNVGILDKSRQYCFRMRSVDFCGQTGSFSNEVCSVTLTGNAAAEKNDLSWSQNPGFTDFDLHVNDQPNPVFKQRPQPNVFSDTNIKCGNNYCYQVLASTEDGAISESNKVCLNAISKKKPPVIKEVLTDVISNLTKISWIPAVSVVNNYSVFASADKSRYDFVVNTGNASHIDAGRNPSSNQFCYKISYTDNCGNSSDLSQATCPVFLTGAVIDALTRKLSWKSYVGWNDGVKEYFVEKVDGNGTAYSSFSIGNSLDYTDVGLDTLEQLIHFRIKALSATGKVSYSNIWDAVQKGNFHMPNAFTPNGDGLNDKFHAEGLFIEEFSMEIWNRNGEGVFATKSFKEGWDGKINGQNAPVDTYMYKVEAKDKLGASYKKNGSLQLIK